MFSFRFLHIFYKSKKFNFSLYILNIIKTNFIVNLREFYILFESYYKYLE